MFHFHFVPIWEGFPRYTPRHCSAASGRSKVPAWDFVLSCLATVVADTCLMLACLLTPLQDVAGEFMMTACPCYTSSLFFCLYPSTFLWSPGGSELALTLLGLHFLFPLHLRPLLSRRLSASVPFLILLDTQLCLLAGAFLPCRRSFPGSHLLSHLLLPKFPCNCLTWLR